jgi:hypothetical protein
MFFAIVDVNLMRVFNDQHGFNFGDALLGRLSATLVSVGLKARHLGKGDFQCTGESREEMELQLLEARTMFKESGADFCFGIGTTPKEAEAALYVAKRGRGGNSSQPTRQ